MDLRRVRGPEGVKRALRCVLGIESRIPFQEYPTSCLIADGAKRADRIEIRNTRRRYEIAEATERRAWSECHAANEEARDASGALQSFLGFCGSAITLPPFFCVAVALARELRVAQLTARFNEKRKTVEVVQKSKAELKERLIHQEAWYARKQLVEFASNRRFDKTALNYAKASAGLPEYSWLHSLRRCTQLLDESLSSTNLNYQLFEMLRKIGQSMRRTDVRKIELRLEKELRKEGCDPMLIAFVSPNWAYMKQAFAQCRGKRYKRSELPYKILTRYFENIERSKIPAETELAKRNQLLSP